MDTILNKVPTPLFCETVQRQSTMYSASSPRNHVSNQSEEYLAATSIPIGLTRVVCTSVCRLWFLKRWLVRPALHSDGFSPLTEECEPFFFAVEMFVQRPIDKAHGLPNLFTATPRASPIQMEFHMRNRRRAEEACWISP